MKKRNRIIFAAEIILTAIICIVLVRVDAGFITTYLKNDMSDKLNSLGKSITDTYSRDINTSSNYELIQKHVAQLARFYVSHTKGNPWSGPALEKLRDCLSAEELYVMDADGRLLHTACSGSSVPVPAYALQTLLGVSEENKVSDLNYEYIELQDDQAPVDKETDSLADKLKETGQSLAESTDSSASEEGSPAGEYKETDISRDEHTDAAASEAEDAAPAAENEESEAETDEENSMEAYGAETNYYVSCYIDPGHILIIRDSVTDLFASLEASDDIVSVLGKSSYGSNGLFYAISTESDNYLYNYPFEDAAGKEQTYFHSLSDGTPAEDICLKDGESKILTILGTTYFCLCKELDFSFLGLDKEYTPSVRLHCALPLSELVFAILFSGSGTLLVVLVSLYLMRMYAKLVILDYFKKKGGKKESRGMKSRLLVLTILCICATAGVSVYLKTLYIYASEINQDVHTAESLKKSLDPINQKQQSGSMIYNNAVTIFTRTSASLLADNPDLLNRDTLRELADILGVEHILVYNSTGTVTASDLNYTGLTLPADPDSSFYDFRWVLYGEPLLIRDELDETYLNAPYYYAAAPMTSNGESYKGMVLLAIPPALRDKLVASFSLDSILKSYSRPGGPFALAVDIETKTVHSASEVYEGAEAEALGLTDEVLTDDFSGFYHLQKRKVLGSCSKSKLYHAVITSYTERLPLMGVNAGLVTALPGILAEFLFYLSLLAYAWSCGMLSEEDRKIFLRTRRKESAKAEEHVLSFLKNVGLAVSGVISLICLLCNAFFKENSIAYYVFVRPWPKGLNIFTVTRCIQCIFIVVFIMAIIMKLLSLLSSLLPSKQETVIRMLLSFAKYISLLGTLFYCLTMLGAPTTSLLASAGVFTVVLSMGAQSLVADILSGLFIIFEGTYKVGDMITVGDWHGQVVEIGIRNTTIRDLISSDVKIMNNSTIKNVINYSIYPSYCAIRVSVEYGMDIEQLEAIIESEKPTFRKNLPYMIGDLMYLGVDDLGDSGVVLKFQAACKNQDFLRMKRALNREVKMMFDRHGINIPFPQIVINEREEK